MATKKKAKKKASPKAKPKPAAKKKAAAVKKGPRQTSLPGMEDRAIEALDDAALSYAETRDERIGLSKEEGDKKKVLMGLMHANKKTKYTHGNISIEIVPEGEKIKVKIAAEGSAEPGDPGQTVEEEEVETDQEDVEVEVGEEDETVEVEEPEESEDEESE